MKTTKILPFFLLIVLTLAALFLKNCKGNAIQNDRTLPYSKKINNKTSVGEGKGLNRHPSIIDYSKHARCRMSCRDITEAEVRDILQNGTINYKKSQLQLTECNKKYAVEGYSKDNQHLRIVFAPCNEEVTVVTCIDLGKGWDCDCK